MTDIIPITLSNIHEVKPYAAEFMQTLQEPCDPDYYQHRWEGFLKAGIGVGWWAYVDGKCTGGIGGIIAPDILCGKSTLIELFWYITPKYRRCGILVYREMKRYVEDKNLRWAMIHMERSMPEKLKEFYTKQGFRLLETHWIRCPNSGRK